jgi:hypothetical protein
MRYRGSGFGNRCEFGDYFYVRRGLGGTFRLDTSRGVLGSGKLEYTTFEFGFKTKAEAMERAKSLVLSPSSRRARFRFVKGGLGQDDRIGEE